LGLALVPDDVITEAEKGCAKLRMKQKTRFKFLP